MYKVAIKKILKIASLRGRRPLHPVIMALAVTDKAPDKIIHLTSMYGQIIKERQPKWSGCKYKWFGSRCPIFLTQAITFVPLCSLDRLVPWYLFLIRNEAENLVRDGLAGGEPLASKAFKDLLPVGRAFSGTGLDHIKLSGHLGVWKSSDLFHQECHVFHLLLLLLHSYLNAWAY